MNIQTEHLDNHTARLTIEVEADRLEQAIRQAARRISKKSRIPGFRPGKAPMPVVLNLFGREYVLSEALDDLGNDLYREALEASEVQPYAAGSLEKVEEDGRKLIFIVPKRPQVDLGSYRDIRVEYEIKEVTDEMVNDAMEDLRQNQALVEPVERPAQIDDQITFEHFEIVVLPEADEATELDADSEAAEDPADETEQEDDQERVLIHQHDYDRVLRDDENDLFPGFSAELVGLAAGDEKTFTLTVPADYDFEDVAGRTLRVEAFTKAVQSRLVPNWSDTLAETISKGEFKTMLELRVDVRNRLEELAERGATDGAAQAALEKLVEGAAIHYPEEIVQEYIDDILQELDQNLRQQGLTLADLLKMTGRKEETLREEYHERAVERAERALALGQLVHDEDLHVSDEDLDIEIDRMSTMLGGEQAGKFKQFLNTEQSRLSIANRVASDRALARLVAIAKGENPSKDTPAAPADEAATPAEETADAAESASEAAETNTAE